jgi:hypothetical protein
VDRIGKSVLSPCYLNVARRDAEHCGSCRDDRRIRNVHTIDEKRARHGAVKIGCRLVAALRAHKFHHFERETRIDVTARRVDRDIHAASQVYETLAYSRPLRIGERLIRSLRRCVGMQFEWQPTRTDAELPRRFFDPDRAEVAERSNDIGPNVQNLIIIHGNPHGSPASPYRPRNAFTRLVRKTQAVSEQRAPLQS